MTTTVIATPTATRRRTGWWALAVATTAAALVLTACGSDEGTADLPGAGVGGQDPATVGAAFAVAYAAGDTPTACTFLGPDELADFNEKGWCGALQGWNTTGFIKDQCTAYDGSRTYIYEAAAAVARDRWFGFTVIPGATPGTWQVDSVRRIYDPSPAYCPSEPNPSDGNPTGSSPVGMTTGLPSS